MTERRFNEAEVAEIFERAAESQQTGLSRVPPSEGMTLTELQEIGRQVGIAPEDLVNAAKAIERRGVATSRQFLGLPIGVGLTIDLDRKLTDEEWERFVADMRATFDARGTLRQEGSLRHWANGNLQAHLEPTATGNRIRLRTVKGNARVLINSGLVMLGIATVGIGATAVGVGGAEFGSLSSLGMLGTIGAVIAGIGAFQLPGWARLRRRQMEEVAARIAGVAGVQSTHDWHNER